MTFLDYFPAVPAIDYTVGNVVPGAQAQVFARTDTSFTTPLPITDLNGVAFAGNILVAGPTGIFPDFLCAGFTEVTAVASGLTTPIESYIGRLFRAIPNPSALADGQALVVSGGQWVAGTVSGGGGGGDTPVQIGTLTLPSSPSLGQTVTVLADSSTVFPGTITWDSGGAPVFAGDRRIVTFVWDGVSWIGTYGLSVPRLPDTTPPAWSATLTTGTPTSTSVTVSASALATDLNLAGYDVSLDSGTTWTAIVTSGTTFTITGLAGGTAYPAPRFRARDYAGNLSGVLTAQSFTTVGTRDDFGSPTGELNGRTVGSTTWAATAGQFAVGSGVVQNSVDVDGIIGYFTPGDQNSFNLDCSITWTGSAENPGIVFRRIDANNYYYISLQPGIGRIALYKVTGGTHTQLDTKTVSAITATGTVGLHMSVSGTQFSLKAAGVDVWANATILSAYSSSEVGVGIRRGRTSPTSTNSQFDFIAYADV